MYAIIAAAERVPALEADKRRLEQLLGEAYERIAAQAELLAKRAEAPEKIVEPACGTGAFFTNRETLDRIALSEEVMRLRRLLEPFARLAASSHPDHYSIIPVFGMITDVATLGDCRAALAELEKSGWTPPVSG